MNTLNRFIEINRLLRSISAKSHDAVSTIDSDGIDAARAIIGYIKRDFRALRRLWPNPDSPHIAKLQELISRNDDHAQNWDDITDKLMPYLEDEFDDFYSSLPTGATSLGIEGFLHPAIVRSSYRQYRDGHYRDAVFNAIVAVFELIRERTCQDDDGAQLVAKTFSLDSPILVLSTLDTESGRNEQKGFIQMLQGAFLGIRNPKAHSLNTDLTEENAGQYLVFASLLARRVEEARLVKSLPPKRSRKGMQRMQKS